MKRINESVLWLNVFLHKNVAAETIKQGGRDIFILEDKIEPFIDEYTEMVKISESTWMIDQWKRRR